MYAIGMAQKDKLFSFRLTGALGESLSWARKIFGDEITMGETARRLMEERVEQLQFLENERIRVLQERPRQALLDIVAKWRNGEILIRSEWAFLAESCHQTYESVSHRREFIDRDLISANIRAFGAVIYLRNSVTQEKGRVEDGYYLGNLGNRGSQDLCSRVDEVVSEMPAYPSTGWGIYGARNLEVALRDEPPIDTVALDAALRPFLSALIQVASRGYWYRHKTSILDSPNSEWGASDYALRAIKHGKFSLSPLGHEHKITAALDFGEVAPMLMAINNYVEFDDFSTVLKIALSSEASVFAM